MTVLGPGTLKIGTVGSEIDVSCNVNNATLTSSKDQGDSKTMLCGTSKPGSVTYAWSLSGNLDIDLEAGADGLFAMSQLQPGTQQPFSFTANTAEGTNASGILILDPLDYGSSDGYGADLASDFEFAVVDKVTWDWGGAGPVAATGATAGSPGSWTPAGSTPPANAAAAGSVTASPASAWTTGQYVQGGTAGTAGEMHWDGSAWATGKAA